MQTSPPPTGRFTRRRGRPPAPRPARDYGTPELQRQRQRYATAEPLDRLVNRNLITGAEFHAARHLGWLHRQRYGCRLLRALDPSAAHSALHDADPMRSERLEAELRRLLTRLRGCGAESLVLALVVHHYPPRILEQPGCPRAQAEYRQLKRGLKILSAGA